MAIERPDLEDLRESVEVFFYSAWSILYYTGSWIKKNYHRFIHLVWLFGFSIAYCHTLSDVWMWIGAVPAIIYSIAWAVGLRKCFENGSS